MWICSKCFEEEDFEQGQMQMLEDALALNLHFGEQHEHEDADENEDEDENEADEQDEGDDPDKNGVEDPRRNHGERRDPKPRITSITLPMWPSFLTQRFPTETLEWFQCPTCDLCEYRIRMVPGLAGS